MSEVNYVKDLIVKYDVDVLVIGGSQSRVAAAISAKRTNPDSSVMLIEQFGYLGGQSIGTMVIHYEQREYTNNKGQVITRGIGKEIIQRCVAKGHSDPLYQEWLDGKGPPYQGVQDARAVGDIPLNLEDLKVVFQEMCDEASIQVKLYTKLVDIIKDDGDGASFPKPTHAVIADMSGLSAISAKIFVDCSANNDVAFFIGPDNISIPSNPLMAMQTYAWIGGVDCVKWVEALWEHPENWQLKYPNNKEQMLQHVYEGKVIIMKGGADYLDLAEEKYPGILAELEQFATPIIYYWIKTQKITPYKVGDTTYYDSVWAIEGPVSNAIQSNPDNVSTFAQKQLRGVHIMQKIHSVLPGWENCFVDRTVDRVGFRETRVLNGLYKMKDFDIKNAADFEDVIGRGCGHDISRINPAWEFGFDIPYRALLPEKIDNLLVGARSVSCEPEEKALTALNAHRGIQATIVCSQAAGTAAALSLKNQVIPRDLDILELQDALRAQDVVLDPPEE